MILQLFVIGTKNHFRINFWFISKSETVNCMKNADLSEKSGNL